MDSYIFISVTYIFLKFPLIPSSLGSHDRSVRGASTRGNLLRHSCGPKLKMGEIKSASVLVYFLLLSCLSLSYSWSVDMFRTLKADLYTFVLIGPWVSDGK